MTCRRRARAAATVVAVLGCWCLAVVADEHQAPQTPTFRSGITLVPLDVRVLDRNGRPVADLTKDDFAVAEDGIPQRISHFDRQSLVAETAETAPPRILRTTGAGELRQQNRRVFLIALGRYWLPRARFGAVEAITTFLRQRLLPQDYAAVCAWDRATDVTTDHEALAQVVERLHAYLTAVERGRDAPDKIAALYNRGGQPTPPAIRAELDEVFQPAASVMRSVPLVTSHEISGLLRRIEGHALTLANAGRPPEAKYSPHLPGSRDEEARSIARVPTSNVLNIFSAIQYLRYIEGEKHLLYFSAGGIHMLALEDDRDLARIASDARVVVHVIRLNSVAGAVGILAGVSMFPGGRFASMASKHIAELTGGEAFMNHYPDRALARIDQATRVGYLLGYYPSNDKLDGRHRKVTVTVKRPSGATVLYRRSYIATDQPFPYDERQFIVQDRIMTAAEYEDEIRDIPLALTVSTRRKAVAAEVRIDASKVTLEESGGRRTGTLEVAFFCTDRQERPVGQLWQKMDLRLREDTYRRALADGLRHTAEIPVEGAAAYVKVVVYDYLSDRFGSTIVRLR